MNPQHCVDYTATKYGVHVAELLGTQRLRRIAHPRQHCYHLIRKLTDYSLPDIGRLFHRDHTTILQGLQAVDLRMMGHSYLQEISLDVHKLKMSYGVPMFQRSISRAVFHRSGSLPNDAGQNTQSPASP